MADSPAQNNDGVVTFTVTADGTNVSDEIGILAIEVFFRVNRIARAELTIRDGDLASQAFPVGESDHFKPGTKIEIQAGYGNDEDSLFKGVVVNHAMHVANNTQSILSITCMDCAVKMTVARRSQSYLQQKDSDIIGTLVGRCTDLAVGKIEATSATHDELVQFNCSDWDFMLTRAEANALVVCNLNNTLSVTPPATSDAPDFTVTYGTDIISFSAQIDPRYQFAQVTGEGWDPDTQQMAQGQAGSAEISNQGNLSSNTLASVINLDDYRLQTSSDLAEDVLTDWAKGQQIKSALAKVRGALTFQGNANVKINTLIEITGVSERFSGPQYISGVHQKIEAGHWTTTVDLGLSPQWSSEHRDLGAPPAAGWIPPVDGLQIGVVTQLDQDPQSQYRIQVKIPALGESDNTVWARLSSYYATNTSGNFFIPEINDEVIVAFLNNDPSSPIILGCLYSSKHTPAYDITADNNIKALVTRSQLKIEFNEENKVITLITPANNKVVLDDNDKSITLADQNGNTAVLNDSGISLDTPKDIKITASGNISMSAGQAITLKATTDLKGQGTNIDLEADMGFTAKGSATAELSASGMTTIKGGMVKIN